MSANNLDYRLGRDALATKFNKLERIIREIRTTQISTASGIRIVGYPDPGAAVIYDTIAANTTAWFTFTIQPADFNLTTWTLYHSVFVDLPTSALDGAYMLPFGASLSSAQRNMRLSAWPDWAQSNDDTGLRAHIVQVENRDSSPHDIALAGKFYGPYIEVAP